MRTLWLILTALTVLSPAWGQLKLTNPGLTAPETLVYQETVGSAAPRVVEASLSQTGSGTAARLEYRTKAPDLESLYRFDPVTLVSLSSETLTRAADATVRRTADYQDLRPNAGPTDLVVTDLGSLPLALRGYPWGRQASAKVLFLGNLSTGGPGFTLELQVVGREKVEAAGRTWDCWHATTGLGGALSLMVAKTDWWFAADGTHVLVKSAGPAGGPGSPTRTLVLRTAPAGS
jgi:hypothetical protein